MKHNVDTVRHSTAHVMAAAVKNLFPHTKLGIGPTIENGFYYDFDSPHKFTEPDLKKIESEMQKIIKKRASFERIEKNINEATKFAKSIKEPYKEELILDLKKQGEKKVSFYKTNSFIDLCKGPHVATTKDIGFYKLLNIAGAYWKGSENNQMLTRIYGTVWPTKNELEEHVSQLEEIKKRDHKKLGRELELFMFQETAPGMPYWLPKGLIIYNELLSLWREIHRKNEYQEIASPIISEKKLWEKSGHWKYYKEHMFVIPVDKNTTYSVKPMNCPDAMVVFGSKTRSYKELPIRLSDTDILHRFEKSGTLSGLLRVRKFQQDDAHIFATEDQIEEEYVKILKIADYFYSIFNLKYRLRLGTRPEKFLGTQKVWEKAESTLKKILN
jgi:threonyl-tRNA synthetase